MVFAALAFYNLILIQAFVFTELFLLHVVFMTVLGVNTLMEFSTCQRKKDVLFFILAIIFVFFVFFFLKVFLNKDLVKLILPIFTIYLIGTFIGLMILVVGVLTNAWNHLDTDDTFFLRVYMRIFSKNAHKKQFTTLFVFVFLLFSILTLSSQSYVKMSDYLASEKYDNGQLADVDIICALLKKYDPELSHKYIMSSHPGYAYHCNSYFIHIPVINYSSLEDMVVYKNISSKIIEDSPIYPPPEKNTQLKADYLILTQVDIATYFPQFSQIWEENTTLIPSTWNVLYKNPYHVILIEVR